MRLKREFRNEVMKSRVLGIWKAKADRNASKKETVSRMRSVLRMCALVISCLSKRWCFSVMVEPELCCNELKDSG